MRTRSIDTNAEWHIGLNSKHLLCNLSVDERKGDGLLLGKQNHFGQVDLKKKNVLFLRQRPEIFLRPLSLRLSEFINRIPYALRRKPGPQCLNN